MITVSIATFIIETLPSIRNETSGAFDNPVNTTSSFQTLSSGNETKFFWLFFIIETICVTWFSFEFICRLLVAPSKFAFIKNGPNIIDVVSIIPYFIQLIGLIYQKKDSNVSGFSSTLTVLRIVRLVRVFRIFKLSRHFKVIDDETRPNRINPIALRSLLGSSSSCINLFSIMERITSSDVLPLHHRHRFFFVHVFC